MVYGIASAITDNTDKNQNICVTSRKLMLLIYLKNKFNNREYNDYSIIRLILPNTPVIE